MMKLSRDFYRMDTDKSWEAYMRDAMRDVKLRGQYDDNDMNYTNKLIEDIALNRRYRDKYDIFTADVSPMKKGRFLWN